MHAATGPGPVLRPRGRAPTSKTYSREYVCPAGKAHPQRCASGEEADSPTGGTHLSGLSSSPRACLGRNRGEAPAAIAGAAGHLRRSSAHGWVQGKIPHPMVVDRYAGELGMGQSVGGGGPRSRVVMGISLMSDPEQNREVGWTRGTLGRLVREEKKRRGLWRQRILTEGCGGCSARNEGDDLVRSDWVLLVTSRERVEECRGAERALGSLNREGEAVPVASRISTAAGGH